MHNLYRVLLGCAAVLVTTAAARPAQDGSFKVVYTFNLGGDADVRPQGDLVALNGLLYGATAFGGPDGETVVKKTVCNFSWSADHRVIDGATAARAAEVVRGFVEEPGLMAMHMR